MPSIAARATSTNIGTVNSSEAPASRSWKRTSSSPYVGLIVVTVAPATATAWNAIAYSGTLGAMIPSTEPGPKPRACRPPAMRWMASLSSA